LLKSVRPYTSNTIKITVFLFSSSKRFGPFFIFFQPVVRLEVLKIFLAISSVVARGFDIESQKNDLEAGQRGGKRRMYIDRGTRECVSFFIASVTSCKRTIHPLCTEVFTMISQSSILEPTEPKPVAALKLASHILLTAAEAAAMCNVSLRTWWAWDATGKIPRAIRIGRKVFWRPEELKDWVAAGCPERAVWEAMQQS
jgi:predicted DNA-binding transcriptional regulator AlpA